tara:strand:- start:2577 stop:2984 length:408 start_codon:yes stop_codon:yes gene_type:complete
MLNMNNKLIFLYDGECPLCLKETNFLKTKDSSNNIKFVDISNKNFDSSRYKNISYTKAMETLHGILADGKVITGIDVLAYSYELVGLGWIYFPSKIKFIKPLLNLIYNYWAKYRLTFTGRENIQKICESKCERMI